MPGGTAKMLTLSEHDRAYRLHRQRIEDARSMTDNMPPKPHPHLHLRLKQLQLQEERQATIDKENQLMLKRMTEIMMSRENRSKPEKKEFEGKSLNADYREKQHNKIMRDNLAIARRIERTRPVYRVDKWEADYRKGQYLIANWKKKNTKNRIYPVPEKRTPRDRAGDKYSDDDGHYESDFETDSDNDGEEKERKKGTKLPPIKGNHKQDKGNETRRSRADGDQDTHRGKGGRLSPSQDGWETQERKWEYRSPDPDLWMYYGFKPKDSDDEEDDRTPRGAKKKGNVGHSRTSLNSQHVDDRSSHSRPNVDD